MMASRIRSIAVFGDGVVGLSAGLAFLQALPGVKLTIVATGISPAALADRLPGGLPEIRHFHRLVGITEQELIRAGAATHRIGTRFEGWGEHAAVWHHCFETPRPQIHSSPFHHQWMRFRTLRSTKAYDDYSPAVALARAGRFAAAFNQEQSPVEGVDYALRLDPEVYRSHLRQLIARTKATFVDGQIAGLERTSDGRAAHVSLADGRRIEADLFVDCAGPDAPLLSRLEAPFADWSAFLPCDQLSIAEQAPAINLTDTAAATNTGYTYAIPMPSRSRRISVWSTRYGAEADESTTELVTIRPGVRTSSWVANVVAFGDSAVALDPLESTNLLLAQSAIRRAVTLMPDTDFQPLVLQEFNRRTLAECERVRDFVAAHYIAATKRLGPFWGSIRNWSVSDSLAHTLEQFKSRGRLPKYEEETFRDESWFAMMFGLGVYPQAPDPACFRVDESVSLSALDRLAQSSAELPKRLPPYGDYLRHVRSGQTPGAAQ